VSGEELAALLYEAFLIVVPFERQDINFASDKFRADRGELKEGARFLAIYDQTYGSLHLSGRLLEGDTFRRTLETASSLLTTSTDLTLSASSRDALDALGQCAQLGGRDFAFDSSSTVDSSGDARVRVIQPGSRGLDVMRDNEEFLIEAVFFSPALTTLAYRGRLASNTRVSVVDVIPHSHIAEIPGESKCGLYSPDTGEFQELDD